MRANEKNPGRAGNVDHLVEWGLVARGRWLLQPVIDRPDLVDRAENQDVASFSDAELGAFWRGCDTIGWPFGGLLKLLALTAQRKSEIGELRWSEINTSDKTIELAGARYKTGKAHVVPLSAAALDIIASLPRFDGCDYVFTTTGKQPVSGFSKAKPPSMHSC